MKNKNILYILAALLVFVLIAVAYCAPVLSGKSIIQPDIVNYKGSAQEMQEFQNKTGENVYWSNAMFSGMPTYQTGARYDFDLIKSIDMVFRFLPRPADYIFLLFTGFFILGITIFKDWKYATIGAIFFAVGAYFFIIIGAGHNAKVHAIAYFAPLVAGILLLYRGKYILGFVLTTLFMGLELAANHPQMTYYLFLGLIVFGVIQLVDAIKNKKIKEFAYASGLAAVAIFLGLGLNASRLLTTYEYGKETTRGKSEMTLLKEKGDGLEKSYITDWSYGKLETMNLFIPNFMGGASTPEQGDLKNYISELQNQSAAIGDDEMNQQAFQYLSQKPATTYWGDQQFTAGPAYQGAVVILFFILGIFLVKGKYANYKWWLLGATILSIVLAWGKNFEFLTDLFIDYFPMYNKFRAVSSMLVLAEFTMPFLAIFALYVFFKDETLTDDFKKKILYYAGGGTMAFLLILYLFGGSIFSFSTTGDQDFNNYFLKIIGQYNPNAVGTWDTILKSLDKAILKDRIQLFKDDTFRTMLFVGLSLVLLLAYQFGKIKNQSVVLLAIACIALFDGLQVDKRYLNDKNFVSKMIVDNPFPTEESPRLMAEAAESPILNGIAQKIPYNKALFDLKNKDKGHYRVFDNVFSTFNEASTSYFASSIGGYHGAKLGKYQDIIDLYFSGDEKVKALGITGQNEMMNILNILNAKYIVVSDSSGMPIVQPNPEAYGNAWFASNVVSVTDANKEILALKDHDLKNTVILRNDLYPNQKKSFGRDANSSIKLSDYSPMKMVYNTESTTDQIGVFSEIYYSHGWVATIDGKEQPILKADYLLRALEIPAGKHEVIMAFKPSIVTTGNYIVLFSNVVFILVLFGGIYLYWKQEKTNKNASVEAA